MSSVGVCETLMVTLALATSPPLRLRRLTETVTTICKDGEAGRSKVPRSRSTRGAEPSAATAPLAFAARRHGTPLTEHDQEKESWLPADTGVEGAAQVDIPEASSMTYGHWSGSKESEASSESDPLACTVRKLPPAIAATTGDASSDRICVVEEGGCNARYKYQDFSSLQISIATNAMDEAIPGQTEERRQ